MRWHGGKVNSLQSILVNGHHAYNIHLPCANRMIRMWMPILLTTKMMTRTCSLFLLINKEPHEGEWYVLPWILLTPWCLNFGFNAYVVMISILYYCTYGSLTDYPNSLFGLVWLHFRVCSLQPIPYFCCKKYFINII